MNGIHCLRSNIENPTESELWSIYIMLTDIESAFRFMKSDLGLRPVYHQKTQRVDGHIFVTILAYHIIQTIRYQLKQHDLNWDWDSIRKSMSTQMRTTTIFKAKDNSTWHIRKTSESEPYHARIYTALDMPSKPMKMTKVRIE